MALRLHKVSHWRQRLNRRKGVAKGLLLGAVAQCLVPSAQYLSAQSIFLPNDVRTFEYPLASSRTSALVGRVMHLGRGESAFGAEWEAEAALGEIWPLLALSRGRLPVTLHLGTEAYGRFSLGDAASSMISNDWQVGLVLTADLARWRLALEAYHESSHLGDEYRDRFAAPRVNWSREIVGLWATRRAGQVAMTLNASYAVIPALDVGPEAMSAAIDYQGKPGSVVGGGAARLILALNADLQEYTDWEATFSGRAGVRFADPSGRRGFALLLTWLDGMSPQKQFYLQKSRYVGVEVRFDL